MHLPPSLSSSPPLWTCEDITGVHTHTTTLSIVTVIVILTCARNEIIIVKQPRALCPCMYGKSNKSYYKNTIKRVCFLVFTRNVIITTNISVFINKYLIQLCALSFSLNCRFGVVYLSMCGTTNHHDWLASLSDCLQAVPVEHLWELPVVSPM